MKRHKKPNLCKTKTGKVVKHMKNGRCPKNSHGPALRK